MPGTHTYHLSLWGPTSPQEAALGSLSTGEAKTECIHCQDSQEHSPVVRGSDQRPTGVRGGMSMKQWK